MIRRFWHGWTTPENADAYEELLKNEYSWASARRASPGTAASSSFAGRWAARSSSSR